jgi:hypothetical protein
MSDGRWTDDLDIRELPTARVPSTNRPQRPAHSGSRGDITVPTPRRGEAPPNFQQRPLPPLVPSGDGPRYRLNPEAPTSATRPMEWGVPAPATRPLRPSQAMDDRPRATSAQIKRPWYRRKAFVVVVAILLLVSALSTLGVANVHAQYQQDSRLADDGIAKLKSGITLLRDATAGTASPQQMALAKSDFVAAQTDFARVSHDATQIPGLATQVPVLGGKLSSALHLLPLAETGAQAGILASDALQILLTDLADPLSASSKGLTQTDLDAIGRDLTQADSLLQSAARQVAQLQSADLAVDPRLGPAVAQFKRDLPQIQQGLQDAETAVQVAPLLLGVGKPTNYLVELLDSTELRPGGGFIGNIGIMTLSAGRLADLHVQDVDLLDRPFEFAGGKIPMPSQYSWFQSHVVSNWSVRDSNLDANFPTDALNVEKNYQLEGGTTQVQGVIAITPWVIQKALAITGPIYVPEFNETVNASNMVDLIHYHQLGPGHGSEYVPDPATLTSMRKRFTAYLFQHFMARIKAIQASSRGQFVRLLLNSFATKDVQVYFNDKTAEGLLTDLKIASTIAAPSGDSLFVVDANITGNKANNFITYHASDTVALDASGTATHTTTLQYSWPDTAASRANDYGDTKDYNDYIRVYVPPSAQLISQQGWSAQGTSTAFGRKVFAGLFHMTFGTTATVTLTWKVPGAVVKTGTQWTYTLLRQRQSGVVWQLAEQVKLPSCAAVTNHSANLKAAANNGLTGALSLETDTTFSVTYSC